MRPGLHGFLLPESAADYDELVAINATRYRTCLTCSEPFSPENTTTPAGWRETQISSTCEACFDTLFADLANAQRD